LFNFCEERGQKHITLLIAALTSWNKSEMKSESMAAHVHYLQTSICRIDSRQRIVALHSDFPAMLQHCHLFCNFLSCAIVFTLTSWFSTKIFDSLYLTSGDGNAIILFLFCYNPFLWFDVDMKFWWRYCYNTFLLFCFKLCCGELGIQ